MPAVAAGDDEWDPRVQAVVSKVEKIRGLEFDRPIAVRFLAARSSNAQVTSDESDLTKDDKREIAQAEGAFRALGFVDSDVDLFKEVNSTVGEGTLAFYDPDTERITIKGDGKKKRRHAATRGTIAHAHPCVARSALDLEDLQDSAKTSGEAFAVKALIEGDADHTEDLYVDGLPRCGTAGVRGTLCRHRPCRGRRPGARRLRRSSR